MSRDEHFGSIQCGRRRDAQVSSGAAHLSRSTLAAPANLGFVHDEFGAGCCCVLCVLISASENQPSEQSDAE
eukprot:4343599-Pleurochrysis_carterae.AAC.1